MKRCNCQDECSSCDHGDPYVPCTCTEPCQVHPKTKDVKDPYYAAVWCRVHKQQLITDVQYDAEMNDPNGLWRCPTCGEHALFDDDYWEERHDGKD